MRRATALGLALLLPLAAAAQRSGFEFMGPATQALQRDDTQNPGFLWVAEGQALWRRPGGDGTPACSGCHGDDPATAMRGVAARHPAWSEALGRPVTLAQRINHCRETRQQQRPWAPESPELLAMETVVALASRGLRQAPPADARLAPHVARGRALFERRLGALQLSCAQCHDQRAGLRLGASPIPEGHANGYPTYRLEWQAIGSLERRLRNCMTGVRAEPFAFGAPEFVDLTLYLARRGAGLTMEAPAVRP